MNTATPFSDALLQSEASHAKPFSAADSGKNLEFFRYFLTSALALAIDVSCLAVLVERAHVNYLLAASIGYLSGNAFSFFASATWVFKKHRYKNAANGFLVFTLIGLAGLSINMILLWLGTSLAGIPYLASKAAAAGLSFLFNFLVRRFMLFSDTARVPT